MKKKLAILLSLVLTATMLSACGDGGKETTTTAENGAEETTTEEAEDTEAAGSEIEEGAELVYWSMWGEVEPQGIVIQQAIDAFTDETGVKIEVQYGSRETRKTLQPALDSGETIDLFDEDVERVNVTWGNYLLSLDDYYKEAGMEGQLNGTLMDLAIEYGGGELKSIPYQPSTFVVMYNKDLFDDAGITELPLTWDEYLATCEALKETGVYALTCDDAYLPALFGYVLDRVAGLDRATEIVDADTFDEPEVLVAAQALEELAANGYVDPKIEGNVFPAGQTDIANGSVAMYLNGTWLPNEIKGQVPDGFRWGSFAFPGPIAEGGDGPEANHFGAQCWAVNKDSAYPNAAFAFIQHMVTGEWDQKLADESMGVPMANDAVWPDELAEAKVILDNTTVRLPWAVGMENDPDTTAKTKAAMASLMGGSMTAEEFAAAMAG